MFKVRDLSLEYKNLNDDQFPYTKMQFRILCDGFVIEEGVANVRAMYLHWEKICDAAQLHLQ